MHIFVDESGTFSAASERGSFCLVAALVVPEPSYRAAREALTRFKLGSGFRSQDEVKRKHVSEESYRALLHDMAAIDCFCVAVATDASLNGDAGEHKEQQARVIESYAPNMHFDEGKAMIMKMADDVRSLSNQNYVELWCRTILVHETIQKATLFYAQRRPATLSSFRWRFDQKSKLPNHFEETFSQLVGPLTQSIAIHDPFISLQGADYSKFERFRWHGEYPDWLPPPANGKREDGLIDSGKIWREDLAFVDSVACPGVQLVDLLTSGINGCLRKRFANNSEVAKEIGRFLLRPARGKPVMSLISLNRSSSDGEPVSDHVSDLLRSMARVAKPILA